MRNQLIKRLLNSGVNRKLSKSKLSEQFGVPSCQGHCPKNSNTHQMSHSFTKGKKGIGLHPIPSPPPKKNLPLNSDLELWWIWHQPAIPGEQKWPLGPINNTGPTFCFTHTKPPVFSLGKKRLSLSPESQFSRFPCNSSLHFATLKALVDPKKTVPWLRRYH